VEEKILILQNKKNELAQNLLQTDGTGIQKLSKHDLLEILESKSL
jgi:SNF2 family DNA or RNA helicase